MPSEHNYFQIQEFTHIYEASVIMLKFNHYKETKLKSSAQLQLV